MKKLFLSFVLCIVYFVLSEAQAYTSADVAIANSLADANIIVDQRTNPGAYRLDDSITRQEVIGMSLRLRKVALPNTYTCKGYYTDATFQASHADAWVCRAVELAADRGIITRESAMTRPRDTVTKVEALALAWRAADMDIETGDEDVFYDEQGKIAEPWQENLLQTALKSGVITVTRDTSGGSVRLLWRHKSSATRKEVFALMATLLTMKQVNHQTLYLNFSGEVQYKPRKVQMISTDAALIDNLKNKNFGAVVEMITPKPVQYRTEGTTLFILQKSPERWGQVTYSSISTLFGKVFQQYSPYNPYEKAVSAMLKRFQIASERDFYALPYGELWENTRDYIEQYFIDEFMNAPLVMPSSI